MTKDRPNKQMITLTVAAGASTGTQADPCNPMCGTLKRVEVKCANDGNVAGMKVELLWRERTGGKAYIPIYTGSDNAIADDDTWNDADGVTDVDIPLNFAVDGDYTWRITPDAAPAAEMTVYIRRTFLS